MVDDVDRSPRRARGAGRTIRTYREAYAPRGGQPRATGKNIRSRRFCYWHPIRGLWGRRIVAAVVISRGYDGDACRVSWESEQCAS